MAVENRPSTRPRMALPPAEPTRRIPNQVILVAAMLKAPDTEPDADTFSMLTVIAKRCPDLTFRDFVSGCAMAMVMTEKSERGVQS
jgi:hypothetical protein